MALVNALVGDVWGLGLGPGLGLGLELRLRLGLGFGLGLGGRRAVRCPVQSSSSYSLHSTRHPNPFSTPLVLGSESLSALAPNPSDVPENASG